MRVKLKTLRAAAGVVAAALTAATASAAGVPTLDVRARTGDAAPGGGTYGTYFADAVLNNAGQVAFHSASPDDDAAGGVYLVGPDAGERVLSASGTLPDGTGYRFGGSGAYPRHQRLVLNDAGTVALALTALSDPDDPFSGTNSTAVWDAGGLRVLGKSITHRPALNDAGQVLHVARGTDGRLALVRSDPGGSQVTLAADGDAAPGGGTLKFNEFSLLEFDAPSLGAGGQAAFWADVVPAGGGAAEPVVFRADAGGVTAIARAGRPVEGTGDLVTDLGTAGSPPYRYAGINASGQVSLLGRTSAGRAYSEALVGDGRALRTIVRPGAASPLDGAAPPFGAAGFVGEPMINDAGQAAFTVATGDFSDVGIVRADPDGTLTLVARKGQVAHDGTQLDPRQWLAGPARINAAGQVAFWARPVQAPPGVAIFFFDDRLGLLTVAAHGDVIGDDVARSVAFYPWDEFQSAGRPDPLGDGFNDAGQVAFRYYTTFSGAGPGGVAVWTPPDVEDLLAGDANLDGAVTIADFAVLRANFGDDAAYFTTGDFDGDGGVTIADFALLRANFGGSAQEAAGMDAWAAAAVPEPAGLWLLAAGGLGLARRRRAAARGAAAPKPRV